MWLLGQGACHGVNAMHCQWHVALSDETQPSENDMQGCLQTYASHRSFDASVQSQLFPAPASQPRISTRDKIRQVIVELANSDAFIDIIVDKLQHKGSQL